jgi:hypothetical protein
MTVLLIEVLHCLKKVENIDTLLRHWTNRIAMGL